MNLSKAQRVAIVFWLAVLASSARPALAGGGPENVLLVVNSASASSQTVANFFQQLRGVPAVNVVYLDWRGGEARTDIETFRQKILLPVLHEIESRQLTQQIDYVVYSSGFPWAINFAAEVPPDRKAEQSNPEGSLTGLTYLFNPVLGKDAATYASLTSNRYMRLREKLDGGTYELDAKASGQSVEMQSKRLSVQSDDTSVGSHGFRSWYGWDENGKLIEAGGTRYLLSTVLGVTYGRGNSLAEIVKYLRRSAPADGTSPPGTIYFMDNSDVRTTTRRPGFQMAVDQLKKLHVAATIAQGDVPKGRPDVQGLLTGVPELNWEKSGSTILPGAICENFTSYGGIFDTTAGQTPLSVFLRNGAAGTSGTVVEPFAIQNKFPHAMIQVHYARGCSLAEAFYQAVYAPYQLLIVGDPLCRPWANIPEVKVEGAKAGDVLKGKVTLKPSAKLPRGGTADRFRLFVDGLQHAACSAGETLELDTTAFWDGEHELRVVGIENSAIESQGRETMSVRFDNYGKTIQFEVTPKKVVPAGEPIKLTASAPGAIGVAFYRNQKLIAKFSGESGEAIVDSKLLGEGPVAIRAIGWGSKNMSDVSQHVASPWVPLTIENGSAGK
jgi:uncharacterized protein (TIGR03790 family)